MVKVPEGMAEEYPVLQGIRGAFMCKLGVSFQFPAVKIYFLGMDCHISQKTTYSLKTGFESPGLQSLLPLKWHA